MTVIMNDFPEIKDPKGQANYNKVLDFNNNGKIDSFEPLGHRHLHYIALNQGKIKPRVLAIDGEVFKQKYPNLNPLEVYLKRIEAITEYVKNYQDSAPLIVSSSITFGHGADAGDFSIFIYPSELNSISEGANLENYHKEPHRSQILKYLKENRPETYKIIETTQKLIQALNELGPEGQAKGFLVESLGNHNMINLLSLAGAKLNGFSLNDGSIAKYNSKVINSADFVSDGQLDFKSLTPINDSSSSIPIDIDSDQKTNFSINKEDMGTSLIGANLNQAKADREDIELAKKLMEYFYLKFSDSEHLQLLFTKPRTIHFIDKLGITISRKSYELDKNNLLKISYFGSSFAKPVDKWLDSNMK